MYFHWLSLGVSLVRCFVVFRDSDVGGKSTIEEIKHS